MEIYNTDISHSGEIQALANGKVQMDPELWLRTPLPREISG